MYVIVILRGIFRPLIIHWGFCLDSSVLGSYTLGLLSSSLNCLGDWESLAIAFLFTLSFISIYTIPRWKSICAWRACIALDVGMRLVGEFLGSFLCCVLFTFVSFIFRSREF
jgi:hypothetical protein